MRTYLLNGLWQLNGNGFTCEGKVPGSVLSFLLDNKMIDDPFYRDNEDQAFAILNHGYDFSREFELAEIKNDIFLCCDGLDTLATIYMNDKLVAKTKNMHRAYRFDVSNLLKVGTNKILIHFDPVDEYIKAKDKEYKLIGGSIDPLKAFGHIRKAHSMLGWDWGPKLPDIGIWKNIYLLEKNSSEIIDLDVKTRLDGKKAFVKVNVALDGNAQIKVELIAPDGSKKTVLANQEFEVENPKLWWPNGLGEHPLYTINVFAIENGAVVDSKTKKIGLREIKLVREPDEYGESFYHEINGIPFFAMGADYIPQDSIFSRITKERTRQLLEDCIFANFNTLRIWGGGYYPEDFFFDICDELGIAVFMDLMFACSMYHFDKDMIEEVEEEVRQNVKRVCSHPSLIMISGNNEIETCYAHYAGESEEKYPYKKTYIEVFENRFPKLINSICPEIPYTSSSPTTHGQFVDPQNDSIGDTHYWSVWHENAPIKDYRNHYFRYLSEFGFQSFPSRKTIDAFTIEEDRNIFSYVMEKHQKNDTANGKIMNYISKSFLYPTSFDTLIYTSQLLQAEAMRIAVEHLRSNRGRCMGALYWQLNDIWPVASWASIDYYGRYKALHYFARRFYAPVLISCRETGEDDCRNGVNAEASLHPILTKAQVAVTNDSIFDISGKVVVCLRDSTGRVLDQYEEDVVVPKLSAKKLKDIDYNSTDFFNNFVSYELIVDNKVVSSGTSLFTNPKFYKFKNPNLRYEIKDDEIIVYADNYAKFVEILSDEDFVLSDNYFDVFDGKKAVKILKGCCKNLTLRSAYDIK